MTVANPASSPGRPRRRRGRATASSCSAILAQASAFDHRQGTLRRHEDRRLELQHGARPQGRRAAATLAPDIAVVCECAEPERLRLRSRSSWMQGDPVWIGRNPHKGLAVFAFNGYAVRLARVLSSRAALHRAGPCRRARPNATCWRCGRRTPAPAASASTSSGRCAGRCRATRTSSASGRPWSRATSTATRSGTSRAGASTIRPRSASSRRASAWSAPITPSAARRTAQESEPTLYWRDRTKDGPTYHIDYVFLPSPGSARCADLSIGTFETWCGAGLSDHVPVVVDVDV